MNTTKNTPAKKTAKMNGNLNSLITSRVIEGLLILKKNSNELLTVGKYTCDNALIGGFQAGFSVIGHGLASTSREWSEDGKKAILCLKELIIASMELANSIIIGTDGTISTKKNSDSNFCYLWEEDGWMITDELLLNVFKATMAFKPIKENLVGTVSEYVLQSELLAAIYLISSGMNESIHNTNMKQASTVIAILNKKFPEAQIPNQLSGTYDITTEHGRGIFKVNWVFSDTRVIACEFVEGINPSSRMICSDIDINDILEIKLV